MYGANAGQVGRLRIRATTNQAVLCIEPFYASDGDFLYAAMSAAAPRLLRQTQGSGQPNLNAGIIKGFRLPWPSRATRQAFARAFNAVELQSSAINRVTVAKRELKRGLMQELLTGRRRFPQFGPDRRGALEQELPVGWTVSTLGKVADIQVSNVDKHSRADHLPVRLCNYMDVWTRPFIEDGQGFMSSTASAAEIARFGLRAGDVLLTKDSETREEIAEPSVVLSAGEDLVLGYHVALARPDPVNADGQFLAAQLRLPRFRQHFVRSAQGATRFGLTLEALRSAPVWIPSLAEQRCIAELDLTLHREIELLECQREQFELQKRALMQKLLSGELEIPDDLEA
jgi:type I restriction enzyme S subunit